MIANLFLLGFVKIADNAVSTAKNITLYNGRRFLSAFFTIISQILFFYVVSGVVSDNSFWSVVIVSIGAGVGSLVASTINDIVSKERTWMNIITSSNIDETRRLSDFLKNVKIKHILFDSYGKHSEQNLTLLVFAKSKADSKTINQYLDGVDNKHNHIFLRQIVD